MSVASVILDGIRSQKHRQGQSTSSLSGRTLRPGTNRTTTSSQSTSDPRASYGSTEEPSRPPRTQSYGQMSAAQESIDAAKAMYTNQAGQQQQQQRPAGPDRTSSSSAAAAAAAAMGGQKPVAARNPYQRSSTDYTQAGTRSSGGYGSPLDTHPENAPYGAPQQPQLPQQPPYNPAAYAHVSGYPQQPIPIQQQVQPVAKPPFNAAPQISPPPAAPIPDAALTQVVAAPQRKAGPGSRESGTIQRIGLDHFNFLAVLGRGNFGKVMLAETKSTKKLYAIKVLKKEFIIENDEVESTRSEKRVFLLANKERHPFLLNLHACFQTETRVYFVMEYISGGDLMLHIQRGQFGTKRAQ